MGDYTIIMQAGNLCTCNDEILNLCCITRVETNAAGTEAMALEALSGFSFVLNHNSTFVTGGEQCVSVH